MTDIDKKRIRYLRGEGLGYKAIASRLHLTESAVKGICRRGGFGGSNAVETIDSVCRQCGLPLVRIGMYKKKFCSDTCRALWWGQHRYLQISKAENRNTCAACGSVFYNSPSRHRKYCCHSCYINARFKEVKHCDSQTI